MRNKRFSWVALAAFIAAGALLASGCKQPGGDAGKNGGTTNPPTDAGKSPQGGSGGASIVTEDVEFEENLPIGKLTVWLSSQGATVRFIDTKNVQYAGNGDVGKDGSVQFELHEVNHPDNTIPFIGKYEPKAKRFILRRLTKTYPTNDVFISKPIVGNVPYPRKSFVRYMQNVNGNLSVAVVITLDGDRVFLNAWYGEQGAKKHFVAAETQISGNEAQAELTFDKTTYTVVMTFTEDPGEDDSKTNWYLGERKADAGGTNIRYVGGFRYYIKSEENKYTGALISQDIVTKKSLDLFSTLPANTTNKIGTLSINIVGNEVQLQLVSKELTNDKMRKVRTLTLEKMNGKKLYQSKPMTHASVRVLNGDTATGTNEGKIFKIPANPAVDSVFTFYTTTGASYDLEKHTTFDFRIIDYNPADKSFRLEAKYLPEATASTPASGVSPYTGFNRQAGAKLLGTDAGQLVYYRTAGTYTGTLLNGNTRITP